MIKEEYIKEKYNAYLLRHYKGVAYLDNQSIPINEREQYIPAFRKLCEELNNLLLQMDKEKINYTDHEVIYGFNTDQDMILEHDKT